MVAPVSTAHAQIQHKQPEPRQQAYVQPKPPTAPVQPSSEDRGKIVNTSV